MTTLADLAPSYDAVLSDVWGVVHNGIAPFPTAVDALRRFRQAGGRVVLITNAPRAAAPIIAMLDDMGCTVVGPAMRFERALEMLEQGVAADVAILDVNIGGRKVFELAERISARGMPILFATGYGRSGIPQEWQHRPILQKPYTEHEVRAGLQAALAASA